MSNQKTDGGSRKGRSGGRNRTPATTPENLAEQLVADTLRRRRSKCSSGNCGDEGGCATGGCGVGSLVDQIAKAFDYTDKRRIIEVEFKGFRRDFVTLPDEVDGLRVGERVIVEFGGSVHWALVSMVGTLVHAKRKAKRLSGEDLPRLMRRANEQDRKKIDSCAASERQAYSVCKTRIESFRLPMDLVEAEWQFDHRKLTFYFTSEGRVDFRALVRDLAAIFNTRIELRQIPVRDAARRMGGMGVCGRELCCSTHLGQYEHITLDHAKIQQIPSNPSKLSGQCGRLKCCLLYEIDTYIEGLKRFPTVETSVTTSLGSGSVQKIDLFKEKIYIYHRERSDWEVLTLDEFNTLLSSSATVDTSSTGIAPEVRKQKRKETPRHQKGQRGKGSDGRNGNGT